jgi:hypothetical protein
MNNSDLGDAIAAAQDINKGDARKLMPQPRAMKYRSMVLASSR